MYSENRNAVYSDFFLLLGSISRYYNHTFMDFFWWGGCMCGLRDLSAPTRDRTPGPSSESPKS